MKYKTKDLTQVEIAKDRIVTLKDWNFKGFRGLIVEDYKNGLYEVMIPLQNRIVVLLCKEEELNVITNYEYDDEEEREDE